MTCLKRLMRPGSNMNLIVHCRDHDQETKQLLSIAWVCLA